MKHEFDNLKPIKNPALSKMFIEREWYADPERKILGVVVNDSVDHEWMSVVLIKDETGSFRGNIISKGYDKRDKARKYLFSAMSECYNNS